jgi:hypothetical protein
MRLIEANTPKFCFFSIISIILFFGLLQSLAEAQKSLTPDDIISLCSSGKGEQEIKNEISNRGISFQINLAIVKKFTDSGVSPEIIKAVMGISANDSSEGSHPIVFSSPSTPSLTILSDPPGMALYMDGDPKGVTPFLSNKIDKGKHIVRLEHPLFFNQEKPYEFDGEKSAVLRIKMEPREPIIRFNMIVESEELEYPWSWIIRSKPNFENREWLDLIPSTQNFKKDEAVFILSDKAKQTFRATGSACLEVYLWRGQVRSDLSLSDLPPCTVRYIISDIGVHGISLIDLLLRVKVSKIDPFHPEVRLESEAGKLLSTGDQISPLDSETLKARTLENLGIISQQQ